MGGRWGARQIGGGSKRAPCPQSSGPAPAARRPALRARGPAWRSRPRLRYTPPKKLDAVAASWPPPSIRRVRGSPGGRQAAAVWVAEGVGQAQHKLGAGAGDVVIVGCVRGAWGGCGRAEVRGRFEAAAQLHGGLRQRDVVLRPAALALLCGALAAAPARPTTCCPHRAPAGGGNWGAGAGSGGRPRQMAEQPPTCRPPPQPPAARDSLKTRNWGVSFLDRPPGAL